MQRKKEKFLSSDSSVAGRAQKIAQALLSNPKLEIWPNPKVQSRKDRISERLRANQMQTYTLTIGGIALFVYVYRNKGKLPRLNAREQIRDFQAGVVLPGRNVIAVAGELMANRRVRKNGEIETSFVARFDPGELSEDALAAIEEGVREADNAESGEVFAKEADDDSLQTS